jgi:hypothetical protein
MPRGGTGSPLRPRSGRRRGDAKRWSGSPATIICSSSPTGVPYGTPPGAIPRGHPCSSATELRGRVWTATRPSRTRSGFAGRIFSGVSYFRNVPFLSIGCFHDRTDHGMFPSHRATSSGRSQFVITSPFRVLLRASMFHVSVLCACPESWICNATPLRLAE